MGAVGLIAQGLDEAPDALHAGGIDGFSIGPGRHVSRFCIDALIGLEEEVFPEEVTIQAVVVVERALAVSGQTV